jgi:outer membrane receptor protein involved in Fe transport
LKGFACVCVALTLAAAFFQAGADEIVVSGERRERAAADAPFSVSTLGGDEIVGIAADHPSEALNRSAGVLIHRGNGQEHLTAIRSPVLTGGAGAGSFLYLEDGVPLRSAGFANVNELLEAHTEIAGRIEVVRGPSGAAYGANAIHGVINVLTREPTEAFGYFLDASADTIGRVKGRAYMSGERGAHGVFAGLSLLDDPGFREESGADQQKLSLRHVWTGERTTVSTTFAGFNLNQETAGFVEGTNAYLDETLRQQNANPNSFRDAKGVRLASRIDRELSEGLTLSLTPFARWNDMAFLLHFFPSQALEENGHWSVGAQNAIYWDQGDRLSFIAGLDVEYTEGDLSEVQSIPTIGTFTQGVHYDYEIDAVSASPFASLTMDLLPRVKATAAGRVDYTRYDYRNLTADGVVGRFLRPPSRTDEFTTVSPKFSLSYDAGDALIYTSYARGARPPQTTDLYRLQINQTTDPAQPETIDAVELGVKGARGALRYEAAGYFMWKRNFFFRDADGFNVNDGRTRHVGGEAEIGADLPLGFSIDAQASFGRHTYRFDRPVASAPQAGEAISFGDDIDTAPRWIAGARARWSSPDARMAAELEWVHLGRYFLDAANSATYPGHDLLHLRAQWAITDRLAVTFALRNVLDTLYAERGDIAFGTERYFPGEERTAAFGIRING